MDTSNLITQYMLHIATYKYFEETDKKLSPLQSEVFRNYVLRSALLRLANGDAKEIIDIAYKLANESKEY
jgi:hypothetical protein